MADNNSGVRKVEEFPVLEQGLYPDIKGANLPEGSSYVIMSTPLGRSEPELITARFVTLAVRGQQWRPISAKEMYDSTDESNLMFDPQQLSEVWHMQEQGYVEIIEFQGEQFAFPLPELFKLVLDSPGTRVMHT